MTQNEIIKNFEVITDDNLANGIIEEDIVNVTIYVFDDDYDFFIDRIIGGNY